MSVGSRSVDILPACGPEVPVPEKSTEPAAASPSLPLGAERVGVRWGMPERLPVPTSPSHRCAMGPSLSALGGGEGSRTGSTCHALILALWPGWLKRPAQVRGGLPVRARRDASLHPG